MAGIALPPASSEQIAVKDYFQNSKDGNLILNSVAGSGKTTTALYMAAEMPQKRMLVLTYNAKLKLETREKAALLMLRNLEAHSFHAFGVIYYHKHCHRDTVWPADALPPTSLHGYILILYRVWWRSWRMICRARSLVTTS